MATNTSFADSRIRKQAASESISISMADDADREEIYRIRHAVYAHELQQHRTNDAACLRDSLDAANVYVLARISGKIAGFISLTPPGSQTYSIDKYFDRSTLPFSVDDSLYEIRLLT